MMAGAGRCVQDEDRAPLLQLGGVSKSFPEVQALRDVSLTLNRGEILALLGENGAGKSTLIRLLSGAHQPDGGTIRIEGQTAALTSPHAAREYGIGVIYQELSLIPTLSVCDNLFLGNSGGRIRIDRDAERQAAAEVFAQLGVQMPLNVPVRELSIARQQLIEIARALLQDARILIMDEPSASLSPQEVRRLFGIMRELRERGIGIIYVSHRLDEVFEVADRVTVLRDGCHVADARTEELDRTQLISLMVGRSLEYDHVRSSCATTRKRLEVRNLTRGRSVRDVSFTIHEGEILGLAGLVGAGRTETARLIFGADGRDSGEILVDGKPVRITCPADAIREGICLLNEDRRAHGLIPARSVRENFSLAGLAGLQRFGFIRESQERTAFATFVERLRIRIPHQNVAARNLSGGNQQKILLSRWLYRDTQIFLFDEPTRGIDVGAKSEIYQLISDLAQQGRAVLLISSELPEVIRMCDRILVMREGQIAGEIASARTATQQQIMELATR